MSTTNELRSKIIDHSKKEYSSSPHEYDNEQVDLIIKHDCKCDHCNTSIFELNDFPEALTEQNELLCEDCYDNEYRTVCPLCEESWEKDDMTEYFFITKEVSKKVHKPIGLYKILQYPFYYGDCVFGFDAFFDGAIEKVSDLDIKEAYSTINPRSEKDILLDCICPDCAERYMRRDFFIKADSLYCILQKKERLGIFKGYTDERIRSARQDMIHRRIAFRGILQATNNKR